MSFFLPELSFFRDTVLILWQSLSGFMSSVEKKKLFKSSVFFIGSKIQVSSFSFFKRVITWKINGLESMEATIGSLCSPEVQK